MGIGGIIVYFYTGSISLASSVTVTYTMIKLLIYAMYDSLWPERYLPVDELPAATTMKCWSADYRKNSVYKLP
jgi:uncharacterized membrane protein